MFGRFWVVFKLVGLASWKFTKRGAIRYDWWSLVVGYGLMASALIHYVYSFLGDSNHSKAHAPWGNSDTAWVVGYIDLGTMSITGAACLLSATIQTKNICCIVAEFHEMKMRHKVPINRWRFRHGILLALLMTSLVIFDLIFNWQVSASLVGIWYIRFFLYGSELMFTTAVLTLYELFRNANARLRLIIESRSSETRQTLQVLPFVEIIKGYGTVGTRSSPTWTADSLRELAAIHWHLCKIGSQINTAFNGQLLAMFVMLVVRAVTTPYFVFSIVDASSSPATEVILPNIGWVVIHTLQLCLLVWPCSLATVEAAETSAIIVHNLNKPLSARSRNQMEMFLVQLTNHKLNFTVYDMFVIDLTVMTSVAGAVTTYLVILIQFQNSQQPPKTP